MVKCNWLRETATKIMKVLNKKIKFGKEEGYNEKIKMI